jgi:glutathione S-transferase
MSSILYIGQKRYSSWSLRPWILLKHACIPFEEVFQPVEGVGVNANLLSISPSGLVPCIRDGADTVWDSLAICEWANERAAAGKVWPLDSHARIFARCAAAEMHSGFGDLRELLSMHIGMMMPADSPMALTPRVMTQVARISQLWSDAREKWGIPSGAGPYLFGAFSATDAMFAPVIFRFQTYRVPLTDLNAKEYMKAMLADPYMIEWEKAALLETQSPVQKYDTHLRSLGALPRTE